MSSASPAPGTAARTADGTRPDLQTATVPVNPAGQAAQGPSPAPVSAAENPAPLPAAPAEPSPEAGGRRILSTAFVRVGPDGHLTVELRDGRVLVLREVVMGRKDYCGVPVSGVPAGTRYCGRYAEVAAARPGGAPAPARPAPAVSDPALPERGTPGRR